MSKTPISPLRARMIEDMSVRKFGEKTQNDYIRHVKTYVPRPLAGHRHGGGPAPVSSASKCNGCSTGDHQRLGRCAAVLLQGNAQPS